MPPLPEAKPIGLQVAFVLVLVFAVVVMFNYISHDYFLRLHLSAHSKIPLSSRTIKFLDTMTNNVRVTVYYDKEEPFYHTVVDLLSEYRLRNHRISIRIVDYTRDPGAAQQLKSKYAFLAAPAAKNLIIFDCEGKGVKPIDGSGLTKYVLEQIPSETERTFRRRPAAFEGERAFTATLIAVTSPNPLRALFLRGHEEQKIDSDDPSGYREFVRVLNENYIQAEPISLLDNPYALTNCNLLVVAGPKLALTETELHYIDQYLAQGGRMLALFNYLSLNYGSIGLESILANWGVDVSTNIVVDPERFSSPGVDVIVESFSSSHPIVTPLLDSKLQLILPRAISKLRSRSQPVDAPQAEEIAFSGPKSFIKSNPNDRHPFPLMVAVEKGAIKGVVTEKGTARILVVGDSIFLGNRQIFSGANRDFAAYAVNWLLDRPQLLQGVGPKPLHTYQFLITRKQLSAAEWILLGGMPGGALLIGGLVWLRRRS
jgi:ABC-2 type transport system permease protein